MFIGNVFRAHHITIDGNHFFENNTFIAESITIRGNGAVFAGNNRFISNLTVEDANVIYGEILALECSAGHFLSNVEPADVDPGRWDHAPNDLRKRGIVPVTPDFIGKPWFMVLDNEGVFLGPMRPGPDLIAEKSNVFTATRSPNRKHAEAAQILAKNSFANFTAIESVGRIDGLLQYADLVMFWRQLSPCRWEMEEARRNHGPIAGVQRLLDCAYHPERQPD